MDPSDKIARRALEDERLARPVTYLTKFQKTVLKDVAVDIYDSDGVPHQSPEAGALESLSSLGCQLEIDKGGDWRATDRKRPVAPARESQTSFFAAGG